MHIKIDEVIEVDDTLVEFEDTVDTDDDQHLTKKLRQRTVLVTQENDIVEEGSAPDDDDETYTTSPFQYYITYFLSHESLLLFNICSSVVTPNTHPLLLAV